MSICVTQMLPDQFETKFLSDAFRGSAMVDPHASLTGQHNMIGMGTGLDQAAATFEAGWLCGLRQSQPPERGSLDPSLEVYWIDGYHAAVEEMIGETEKRYSRH